MAIIERSTRESSIRNLNPKLLKVFTEYFQAHKLGDLETETRLCCETVTRRETLGRLAGWLDGNPDSSDVLGLILTEQYLFWARVGDRSGTIIAGADLKFIRVQMYSSRLAKETGLEISGHVGGTGDRVNGRLALGPEPAAVTFCEQVIEAVKKARPPRKSIIPWLNK
jgi:hypothetical protein